MFEDHLPGRSSLIARAEIAFVEYLSAAKRDAAPDFDEFCRSHAELEGELRALKQTLSAEFERAALGRPRASIAERLRSKYGDAVDPGVTLGGAVPRSDPGPTSELFRRLHEQGPRSTRYEILGEHARGGMGAILRVWDGDLRRTLAMKVVLGEDDPAAPSATPPFEPKTLGRFLEEAQITGQLDHPGIVPVHELGLASDGRLYFTMRLVKGQDLRHVFDLVRTGEHGWNPTRALGVLLKVCEAMSYAHEKGVIHRDIKPANVMVGDHGEVYVMDWGLARVLGREDTHDLRIAREPASTLSTVRHAEREATADSPIVTMDGDVVGTPSYMPPEQALGRLAELGPASDAYALGAMLYHLLTGEMPYVPANARVSQRTILARVIEGPPRPVHELAPKTPAELIAICEKAMARDPLHRYRDLREVADDLRAYLERRVVRAYEAGAFAEAKKWVQRNRALAASLAMMVIAIAAGGAAFAVKADQATREARRADANATLASQRANEAAEIARIATQKANDVLSLSAIQELKELVERADELWPAYPDKLEELDRWLLDARVLLEGRAAEAERAIEAHPSLMDHKAKLAEIRSRAKSLTPEVLEADRRASPSFAQWQAARAELQWTRRMLGEEPWPSEADVEAELAQEDLPSDAYGLNSMAWSLVDSDPTRIQYGGEMRARCLARRAVAAATESERAEMRSTLAAALYRTGRFDEALAEQRLAVSEVEEAKRNEYARDAAELERAIDSWRGEAARSKAAERVARLSALLAQLETAANERVTWEFDDAGDRWWHAHLSQLVADLAALADAKTGLYSAGTSDAHGFGVVRRRQEAATIEERSVSGAEPRRRWEEAIAAIATSERYGGLVLKPQMGLLPIGADRDSHLWEFSHLQTGAPAERADDGALVLNEEMGLVFVLIPGGTFWMGASKDATKPNYDPQAEPNESPVHALTLEAYFLSKYEMTQGQWLRFCGRNPSNHAAGAKYGDKQCTLLNPVEQVSWIECTETLRRLGLSLPTEAQWERGARAGGTSAWWTGNEKETLSGAANLADAVCKASGGPSTWLYEEWLDDGWMAPAPIGSYRANAFGLHDVVGNVWEVCRDEFGSYALPARAGDGERQVPGASSFSYRGGGFADCAATARAAIRHRGPRQGRAPLIGVRPAMALRR